MIIYQSKVVSVPQEKVNQSLWWTLTYLKTYTLPGVLVEITPSMLHILTLKTEYKEKKGD